MKMRSRTYAGITAQCNTFSLFYRLADLDEHLAQMSVSGLSAVFMVDIDTITVSTSPSGSGHRTAAGCKYRSSGRNRPVHTLMVAAGTLGR